MADDKKDCYTYFSVEPLPQEFLDQGRSVQGRSVIAEIDIQILKVNCKLALLGDAGRVRFIRVFLPGCEGERLTDDQEKIIHQIKEQTVSTLRLSYDPKIKIWSHASRYFLDSGQTPNFKWEFSFEEVQPLDESHFKAAFYADSKLPPLVLKLVSEIQNINIPIQFRYLYLYHFFELEFGENDK